MMILSVISVGALTLREKVDDEGKFAAKVKMGGVLAAFSMGVTGVGVGGCL